MKIEIRCEVEGDCEKCKAYLNSRRIPYTVIKYKQVDPSPQIFIDGQYIGGYEDLLLYC